MKKDIIAFLKRNGFKRMEANHYANDYCGVVYDTDVKQIVVADNAGYTRFCHHDLYSVLGLLSYHSFINRTFVFNPTPTDK